MFLLLALLACMQAFAAEGSPFLDRLLAEQDPTAFAPAEITAEDYQVEWQGQAPSGVNARLVPGSIQWVRVDEVLVIPRATLEVSAEGIESGNFTSQTHTQPFAMENGNGKSRQLVSLVSGDHGLLKVDVKRGGTLLQGKLGLRYRPKKPREQILSDPSCSRTGLSLSENKLPDDVWVYIGCRYVRTEYEGSLRTELDLVIYAENTGPLLVNGTEAQPVDINRWNLRINSANKNVKLESARGSLSLSAPVPKISHRGHIGAGLGPYVLRFDKDTTHFKSLVPMATLYGAYVLPGGNRFVFFGAVTMNSHMYSDAGSYFQFESFRGIDRRVSLNLLIGFHGFAYRSPEANYARFNFPQGFEFFVFDFLKRGYNASAGGFLQPSINGREYYNTWVRWGPSSWFAELNYITAKEDPNFSITTYGLTLGFPLASIL